MSFEKKLAIGKVAESKIASWLISRGCSVLPAYEVIESKFGGPKLFCGDRSLVTPDMLVFSCNGIHWIEAKHKTAFSWHRKTERFVTGVDLHHWDHYKEVAKRTSLDCFLFFNHTGGQAKDSPPSPAGLFYGEINHLNENINHTHDNWGRGGMIYWAMDTLTRIGDPL